MKTEETKQVRPLIVIRNGSLGQNGVQSCFHNEIPYDAQFTAKVGLCQGLFSRYMSCETWWIRVVCAGTFGKCSLCKRNVCISLKFAQFDTMRECTVGWVLGQQQH